MFLRPAEPEDALAVARVHVRSWQVAYRGLLPDEYPGGLRPEDRASKYDSSTRDPLQPRTIVAIREEAILGFATTRLLPDAASGELCALYVNPDDWGQRIGATLVAAARSHLLSLGVQDALLWVLTGNLRAERFYQRDGWTSDGIRRTDTVWGITVEELRYKRRLA